MRQLITRIGGNVPKRKVKRIRLTRRSLQVSRFSDDLIFLIALLLWISGKDRATPSTSEDIIELQDVRMSPIASLRNRQYPPTSSEDFDTAKFPPSFRIARPYGAATRAGLRHRSSRNSNRPRMLHVLRRGASVIKNSMPKIEDVNIIDKYSRVVFPVSFLAFNVGYWVFYVLE